LARTDGHSVGPTLLLKKGKVEALMKGSLRTDELMGAVEPAIPAAGGPNLEAGNMLAKSLSFLGGAVSAGIVLGARVPIIPTSRADTLVARLASCAVASMVAAARRQ
jgi:phosphate acetyltransferase